MRWAVSSIAVWTLDKGKVGGLVKFSRANFMVPIPVAASFEALNAMLEERCGARQGERAGRHAKTDSGPSLKSGLHHDGAALVMVTISSCYAYLL